jgi:hypothetical protein
VDGARNQVFPHAALASDQHRGICRRHALHQRQHLLHFFAAAYNVPEVVALAQRLSEPLVFFTHLLDVKLFVDHQLHLCHGKRLQHVVAGACLHGIHGGFNRSICGHYHKRQCRVQALPFLQKLQPVHAGELEVCQHQINAVLAQAGQPFFRVFRRLDAVAIFAQADLQQAAHARLVFNNEDIRHLLQNSDAL